MRSRPPAATPTWGREARRRGGLHGHGRRRHALTQHDQREEAVALADVLGMPGRAPPASLRPGRDEHLGQRQQGERHLTPDVRQEQAGYPADLHRGDGRGVAARGRPARRVTSGRPQPLGHQRDPHHDIADGYDREVTVDERRRNPGGQDQHADDLHEGQQPVGHVVRVIGRGEPGEVHPGPPDGEEHRDVADDARTEVIAGKAVVQLPGGLRDSHHEAEIEEQLEGSRGPCGSSVLRATIGRSRRRVCRATGGSGVSPVSGVSRDSPLGGISCGPGPDIRHSMNDKCR